MASPAFRNSMLNSPNGSNFSPASSSSPLRSSNEQLETIQSEIRCEACEEEDSITQQPLHFCYACDFTFCETCWNQQLSHRKKTPAKSAVIHEKTNPWIARQVQNALSPPEDDKAYERLCLLDEHTSWFGIDRENQQGEVLMFQDSGRYAEIMAATRYDQARTQLSWDADSHHDTMKDNRTPSLVSFVGQSGAGKSTLISLLVSLKGGGKQVQLAAPVVGMTGKDIPTSEDVHLYMDPSSCFSETPILYADCEGLDGGEREPLGSRFRKSRPESMMPPTPTSKMSNRARYSSSRELVWADTTHRRSRQFAVTNLYPRLLYTFSDTIVFVLKNPRVIEGVFERLIEWAAAALETSSNQAVLPCAIVALNATELNIAPELWDPDVTTARLLESLSQTVHHNSTFQKYAQFWKDRNRRIDTLQQLVLSYYSSIQIIRIPAAGRPKLVQEQVEKLYTAIDSGCQISRERRQSLRMLLNVQELQSYLQCAFDHFALTLDEAFDFVQASFINNPIPEDFGGNILRMAIKMMQQQTPRPNATAIFEQLSSMIASCIMLDSVRHEIRGNAERIFPEYLDHLDFALDDFCKRHWPCEYVESGAEYPIFLQHFDAIMGNSRNLRYLLKQSQCVNVRSGHGAKGHQSKSGNVFAVGDYVSKFTFESYQVDFHASVYSHLHHYMELLQQRIQVGDSQEDAAKSIHREITLPKFYGKSLNGNSRLYQNNSVCLCCLFERPEHFLPCGHILCTSCIKTYGKMKGKTIIEVHDCPLDLTTSLRHQPGIVYLKPESAGCRVLSLDGGGLSVATQLEALRLLEREWHGKLPLWCFFDLIVGTGTSALIALGLTKLGWTLNECARHIERICGQAYVQRTGRKILGIVPLFEAFSKSKFDSAALDTTLKDSFQEASSLFGRRRIGGIPESAVKVGISATSSSGFPVLFTNYNNRSIERLWYQFCRPEIQQMEISVWEAARTTMTTPGLFKPFHHVASKQIYTAAEGIYSNPVSLANSERKLIWPNPSSNSCKDLIISIGTGLDEPIQSSGGSIRSVGSRAFFKDQRELRKTSFPASQPQMVSEDFVENLPSSDSTTRFIRFNPTAVSALPSAIDFDRVKNFQNSRGMDVDKEQIKILAGELLAALFYFESMDDIMEQRDGRFVAEGYLLCRLPNETTELSNLGRLLRERNKAQPYFVIREAGKDPQRLEISPKMIEDMIVKSQFVMSPIQIMLSDRAATVEIMLVMEAEVYWISGLPRTLENIGTRVTRHRQALEARRGTLQSDGSSIHGSIRSRTSRPWTPPVLVRSKSQTSTLHSSSTDRERRPSIASTLHSSNAAAPSAKPDTRSVTSRQESYMSNGSVSPILTSPSLMSPTMASPASDSILDHRASPRPGLSPGASQRSSIATQPLASVRGSVRSQNGINGPFELDGEPKVQELAVSKLRGHAHPMVDGGKHEPEAMPALEERLRTLENLVLQLTEKGRARAQAGREAA